MQELSAVQQCDNPTEAQIRDTHERLVTAVVDLYNQHKHLIGWEHKTLEVV